MALYHIHRPQNFASVIGQEPIIQTLMNQIKTDRLGHAYLFCGPRGVGKTTTARLLAKAANCTNRPADQAEPCEKCSSCLDISKSRALDVVEIDAASHTGVENVRTEIIDNAHIRPTKSRYKIFIIDEVHMLSTSAFNALLKIIEEPPSYILFILATTETHKIPETIISRCQRFQFRRVPLELIIDQLKSIAKEEKITVEPEVVAQIAKKSAGGLRDAIMLLDQLTGTGEKKLTVENTALFLPAVHEEDALAFVQSLIEKNTNSSLGKIDEIVNNDTDLNAFSLSVIEMLRTILLVRFDSNNSENLYAADTNKSLKLLAGQISTPKMVELLDLTIARRNEIRSAPLPQLPLELLVAEWCGEIKKIEIIEVPKIEPTPLPVQVVEKPIETEPVKIDPVVPTPQNVPGRNIDETEIKTVWREMLKEYEETHPSLVTILNIARIVSSQNGVVSITVPYSFHHTKLTNTATRKIIEATLQAKIGQPIQLMVDVEEASPTAQADLDNLAAALGGAVVA